MQWRIWVKLIISGFIVAGIGFSFVSWLQEDIERSWIHIEAATDTLETGLPVYAQFITTQRMRIQEPFQLSRIEVPVYIPTEQVHSLDIRLFQDRHVIEEWQAPKRQGMHTAVLYPSNSRQLAGEIEVQFDGGAIPIDQKDNAPNVFIETADNNYPDGNYRIAQNEKRGDIGLTFYEVVPRYVLFIEKFNDQPMTSIAQGIVGILSVVLLGYLPFIFTPKKEKKE